MSTIGVSQVLETTGYSRSRRNSSKINAIFGIKTKKGGLGEKSVQSIRYQTNNQLDREVEYLRVINMQGRCWFELTPCSTVGLVCDRLITRDSRFQPPSSPLIQLFTVDHYFWVTER